MAPTIYSLCAITSLICAILLFQAYRRSHYHLLAWSGICFSGLAISNVVLVFDKLVIPTIDFSPVRTGIALLSMGVLVFGLVWSNE